MKKGWIFVMVPAGLLLALGVYTVLTRPLIQKIEAKNTWDGGNVLIGGSTSHAEVAYIDYRPVIEQKQAEADFWWGTADGEWRRLEKENFFNHHSYTQVVLRDRASRNSLTGVNRGTRVAKEFQGKFDEVRRTYEKLSLFDRVWAWRVEEFH